MLYIVIKTSTLIKVPIKAEICCNCKVGVVQFRLFVIGLAQYIKLLAVVGIDGSGVLDWGRVIGLLVCSVPRLVGIRLSLSFFLLR
jgi:hypothetical protein